MSEDHHWHKRYHEKAINGYMGLSLELRGAYTTILDLLYDRGEPLVDNERLIAGYLNCSLRKYRSLRDELLEMGKLVRNENGTITNKRFEKERENVTKTSRTRSKAGIKGGKKSGEVRKKTNKNKEGHEANASANTEANAKLYRDRSRVEEIDSSEKISSSESHTGTERIIPTSGAYAFDGKVIKLNKTDFDRWKTTFTGISDFEAELVARDDFLSSLPEHERKNWFHSTSAFFRNKHNQILAANADVRQQQAGGFAF